MSSEMSTMHTTSNESLPIEPEEQKKKHKHPKFVNQANVKTKSPTHHEMHQEVDSNTAELPQKGRSVSPPSAATPVANEHDPLQLKIKPPAPSAVVKPHQRIVSPITHVDLPKPQFPTDEFQKQQAKRQAVQQASTRYGHYASLDSCYFNYLIPCLPNSDLKKDKELEGL